MAPRHGEAAGRVRAASAYSGLRQRELAKRLGISVETLSRMQRGGGTISEERLAQLAEATGVPLAFFQLGFAPLARPVTDTERRLVELEARVERRLAAIEAQLKPEALLDLLPAIPADAERDAVQGARKAGTPRSEGHSQGQAAHGPHSAQR